MNFDTYIAEGIELDENRKRVRQHHRQNRSLEWAIKDRNDMQFNVVGPNGFTNVYGGTRLRYWEDDFSLPEAPDGFFVVGIFYGDEISPNGKKVISNVAIRQYGSEKFEMAKNYASDLKQKEGAAFTNIFLGTKLEAYKDESDKWSYRLPEAA